MGIECWPGLSERSGGELQFTEDDCRAIEKKMQQGLAQFAEQRGAVQGDLQRQRERIQGDLAYLKQQKVTLLRTGAYTAEAYQQDLQRLEAELQEVDAQLDEKKPTEGDFLQCLLTLHELLKTAKLSFKMALDVEKHEIVTSVVHELVFHDQKLTNFKAKKGFAALRICRNVQFGSLF